MFRKFFEKFGPKRLDDPLLGRLVFIKTRDPAKSYWEGTGTFPGTGTQIEFSVDGSSEGPRQGTARVLPQAGGEIR